MALPPIRGPRKPGDDATYLSQPPARDLFSSLPSEVLSIIFAYSKYKQGISRKLLPFTRLNNFHDLYIEAYTREDYTELSLFVKSLVESDPLSNPTTFSSIRTFVRSVQVDLSTELHLDPNLFTRTFKDLFRSLSRLQTLDITTRQSCSDLVPFILLDEAAPSHFPHLKELTLQLETTTPINLTDRRSYQTLHHFRSLSVLKLYGRRISFPGPKVNVEPNRTIKMLELRLYDFVQAPFGDSVLSHFQALESLDFESERRNEHLDFLLSNLRPCLQFLRVRNLAGERSTAAKIGKYTLASSKNLKEIDFGPSTTEPSFFDYLVPPLALVKISLEDRFSVDNYLRLVGGKLPLREIKIPHLHEWWQVRAGQPISTLEGIAHVEANPNENRMSWVLPRWTFDFSYSSSKLLMDIASLEGVEIKGPLTKAVEVQDAWNEERAKMEREVAEIEAALNLVSTSFSW